MKLVLTQAVVLFALHRFKSFRGVIKVGNCFKLERKVSKVDIITTDTTRREQCYTFIFDSLTKKERLREKKMNERKKIWKKEIEKGKKSTFFFNHEQEFSF